MILGNIYSEVGDANNFPLTSEIVYNHKRGNFKAITPYPEFMTDSFYLMNHSEVQKNMVETFNSQDREVSVLENISEDEHSLNVQNVRINNKAIE